MKAINWEPVSRSKFYCAYKKKKKENNNKKDTGVSQSQPRRLQIKYNTHLTLENNLS